MEGSIPDIDISILPSHHSEGNELPPNVIVGWCLVLGGTSVARSQINLAQGDLFRRDYSDRLERKTVRCTHKGARKQDGVR